DRGDREDAREPGAEQAGAARPDAGGRHRVRIRAGRAALTRTPVARRARRARAGYGRRCLSQSSAACAPSRQPWSTVSEWRRSGSSRRSVIAGDLWYSLRVAWLTAGGTVWSRPPAVTSSGPRVLLPVSTWAGERGVKVAVAASNSGLPGDGMA